MSKYEDLAAKMLGVGLLNEVTSSVANCFGKWHMGSSGAVNPTGPNSIKFVNGVVEWFQAKGCLELGIRPIFIKGTYQDFYNMIPVKQRGGLTLPNDHPRISPQDNDTITYSIHHSVNEKPDTATKGFVRGRIDQKLLFLNSDSAEMWRGLIASEDYRQYEECREALILFLKSPVWTEFFKSGQGAGAVMLGGGAPKKDTEIIWSMLELLPENTNFSYVLIDFSTEMLKATRRSIFRKLTSHSVRSVKLEPLESDFMDLHGLTNTLLPRDGKNVAWFLPGGTIGNLNEEDLFRSIASKAHPGDLVVVGAETFVPDSGLDHVLSKYKNNRAFRLIVENPFRNAWHAQDLGPGVEEVLKGMEIAPVDGYQKGYSVVAGAITIETSVKVGSRTIVLLTSTRYKEQEFVDLASKLGFRQEGAAVASPRNEHYKQFVFCYAGEPPKIF